jgi:dephospho-CoA kinase
MLRVGLTGGLGSGKSTVAGILRELGAEVIEADALGRTLMEPGQAVYDEIVRVFGATAVQPDGRLNRAALARLAFHGARVDELNAIVHPAAIAAQKQWMQELFARNPNAIAVIESALIFEVERDARARGEQGTELADWRNRIDRLILVTAPDDVKIARYVARVSQTGVSPADAEADARRRIAFQIPDEQKMPRADYVIQNTSDIAALRAQVVSVWERLKAVATAQQFPQ